MDNWRSIAVIALARPRRGPLASALAKISGSNRATEFPLLCALEWMDVFPTNPDLKLILPYPDVLRTRAHVLADAGLLRCHF